MGEPKDAYGRRADDPRPDSAEANAATGYSDDAQGPVRRAELYDGDTLLGRVWTDDREAVGFLPDEEAGSAGARASARIRAIHRDAFQAHRPPSDILDPFLYAPEGFELRT
jgi:hypothetical protein